VQDKVTADPGPTRESRIVLRFLAAPTEVGYGGTVNGGRLLEWIDKAGYACAVGWSGRYCVTVYVGDVRFTRPVQSGELVEVQAQLVHTGRTSMHVLVTVSSANPRGGAMTPATSCLTVFVAVDESGRPAEVPTWAPRTGQERQQQAWTVARIAVRAEIEAAMSQQTYSSAGTAPESVLRFLAAPTDVNWGGKVHGGTVMRWIDEAAYVCAVGWTGEGAIAVYAGGVRFYRPLLIGSVVETRARLLHTGRRSMHLSVHVRSGDPRTGETELTTHCTIIFVALDRTGEAVPVRPWVPRRGEDVALDEHARTLVQLRSRGRDVLT